MTKYNLSQIMKNAWKLKKSLSLAISEALKKSWAAAKAALENIVEFVTSTGIRVQLPKIVAVSEKQAQYAEDLRRKYLDRTHRYELEKWVKDTREYMNDMDMDELHRAAVADGISDTEAINYLLDADCHTSYRFWVAISESSARKIIDTLKGRQRY